jgi:hypothetical protein
MKADLNPHGLVITRSDRSRMVVNRASARRTPNTCSCSRASVRGSQRTEQPAMVTRWPADCWGACSLCRSAAVCLGLSGAGPTVGSAPCTVDDVRLCPCRHLRRRSSSADVPDNVSESHTAPRSFPGPRHVSRPDVPDNRPLSSRLPSVVVRRNRRRLTRGATGALACGRLCRPRLQ